MWGQDSVRSKESFVEDFLEDPEDDGDIIEVPKGVETADLAS